MNHLILRVGFIAVVAGAGAGVIAAASTVSGLSSYAQRMTELVEVWRPSVSEPVPLSVSAISDPALSGDVIDAFAAVRPLVAGKVTVFDVLDPVEGSAFVLTSDGWLLVPHETSPLGLKMVSGDRLHIVERVVPSGIPSLWFAKVAAEGLAVLPFASDSYPTLGQPLWGLSQSERVELVHVERTQESALHPLERPRQIIELSESLPLRLFVNESGAVVGMTTSVFVPIQEVVGRFSAFVREGKVSVPYTGAIVEERGRIGDGALDGPVWRVESVAPQSPAATAGLKPGDLITKIDNEAVSTQTAHKMWTGLQSADVLKLTITRDSQTLTLPLTIRSLP